MFDDEKILAENIMQKISQWTDKAKPAANNPEVKKNAASLQLLLSNPKVQRDIQTKAVQRLVGDFAASMKNVTDVNQRKEMLLKFYQEWKTKTDPKLLQYFMKSNKLV
jgi:hypothetical protein